MVKKIVAGFAITLFGGGITAAALTDNVTIKTNEIISKGYIGNGVQWDPYQLDYGHGRLEISDSDWQKIYRRLDYMKPGFIRVMINTTSQMEGGRMDPEKNLDNITPILDYCNSRGVTVMFGDWGGGLVDKDAGKINREMIGHAVDYLAYLVGEKGYDCIKYYNFINEPNGWWSSAKGDFKLWSEGVGLFNSLLQRTPVADRVKLVGPDVAIWTDEECWWIDRTTAEFGDAIGLYDIHTYPSKYTVNSGEYYDIVKAYRDAAPAHKKIVMGEIGLKYVHPADSVRYDENIARAKAHTYASVEDSQMSVYDFSYGIDTADALMQTVSAGYSGSIAWMLDDAMHSNEAPDKLKIWGFWNILGEEFFGADEENVRPWYYSWSLLCRYMPAGCDVLAAESDNPSIRVNAVAKDGRYSVFIVNPSDDDREVRITGTDSLHMSDANLYLYEHNSFGRSISDERMSPSVKGVDVGLSEGYCVQLPSNSLVVITNIES